MSGIFINTRNVNNTAEGESTGGGGTGVQINDSTPGTTTAWSGSYINSRLASKSDTGHTHTGAQVSLTTTGFTNNLQAGDTNVQLALDRLDDLTFAAINDGNTGNLTTTKSGSYIEGKVSGIGTGAGLNTTTGAYTAPVGSTYLGASTSLKNSDSLLDTALNTEAANINRIIGAAGLLSTGGTKGNLDSTQYTGAVYINDMTNLTNGLLQLDTALNAIQTNITNGNVYDQLLNTSNAVNFVSVNSCTIAPNTTRAVNQDLNTTNAVTFASVNTRTIDSNTTRSVNQDLNTTNVVTFDELVCRKHDYSAGAPARRYNTSVPVVLTDWFAADLISRYDNFVVLAGATSRLQFIIPAEIVDPPTFYGRLGDSFEFMLRGASNYDNANGGNILFPGGQTIDPLIKQFGWNNPNQMQWMRYTITGRLSFRLDALSGGVTSDQAVTFSSVQTTGVAGIQCTARTRAERVALGSPPAGTIVFAGDLSGTTSQAIPLFRHSISGWSNGWMGFIYPQLRNLTFDAPTPPPVFNLALAADDYLVVVHPQAGATGQTWRLQLPNGNFDPYLSHGMCNVIIVKMKANGGTTWATNTLRVQTNDTIEGGTFVDFTGENRCIHFALTSKPDTSLEWHILAQY